MLEKHGGLGNGPSDKSLSCLNRYGLNEARELFLAIPGIGPETADSILLYALGHPSFVVDAYTRRLLHRHGLVCETIGYAELRDFFMDALPDDSEVYNEYHALLVRTGKEYCRKNAPRCNCCPLAPFLETSPE